MDEGKGCSFSLSLSFPFKLARKEMSRPPPFPARARARAPVLPRCQLGKSKHGLVVPLRATHCQKDLQRGARHGFPPLDILELQPPSETSSRRFPCNHDDGGGDEDSAPAFLLFATSRGLVSYTVREPLLTPLIEIKTKRKTGHDFCSRCCCSRRSPCRRRRRRRCWCVFSPFAFRSSPLQKRARAACGSAFPLPFGKCSTSRPNACS